MHKLTFLLGALLGALAMLAALVAIDEAYRSTRGWPSRVVWEE